MRPYRHFGMIPLKGDRPITKPLCTRDNTTQNNCRLDSREIRIHGSSFRAIQDRVATGTRLCPMLVTCSTHLIPYYSVTLTTSLENSNFKALATCTVYKWLKLDHPISSGMRTIDFSLMFVRE